MIQKWKDEEILTRVSRIDARTLCIQSSQESCIIGTLMNKTHNSYIHVPILRKV